MPQNVPTGNIIIVNKKTTAVEKTTCKEFYLSHNNVKTHIPTSIQKWSVHYPLLILQNQMFG